MKQLIYIAIGLLAGYSTVNAQGKDGLEKNDSLKGIPYFIKVGVGTGGIKLGESTVADVKNMFGEGKEKDEKSKTASGEFTFKTITYKKRNLKFFALMEAPFTVYAIQISEAGARTEKDIVIGTSTEDDVIKAYGEPSFRSSESLEYDNLGVVFEFSNGILQNVLLSKKKDK